MTYESAILFYCSLMIACSMLAGCCMAKDGYFIILAVALFALALVTMETIRRLYMMIVDDTIRLTKRALEEKKEHKE